MVTSYLAMTAQVLGFEMLLETGLSYKNIQDKIDFKLGGRRKEGGEGQERGRVGKGDIVSKGNYVFKGNCMHSILLMKPTHF